MHKMSQKEVNINLCLSSSTNFVYPFIILNIDIDISNFFANKVLHYLDMSIFDCNVQGSHLIERNKNISVKTVL